MISVFLKHKPQHEGSPIYKALLESLTQQIIDLVGVDIDNRANGGIMAMKTIILAINTDSVAQVCFDKPVAFLVQVLDHKRKQCTDHLEAYAKGDNPAGEQLVEKIN